MKTKTKEIFKVKKYILDDDLEKLEYEAILNNKHFIITKENFTYDKAGRAIITIWYTDTQGK